MANGETTAPSEKYSKARRSRHSCLHPDILIGTRYEDGKEIFVLNVVSVLTEAFPWGLELAYTFTCDDKTKSKEVYAKAEEYAVKVQKFLDLMKKAMKIMVCPECMGKKMNKVIAYTSEGTTKPFSMKCTGCDGRGWVEDNGVPWCR